MKLDFSFRGYNRNVIRLSERQKYRDALEIASVKGNIKTFAEFVLFEMNHWNQETDKTRPYNPISD